MKELGPEHWTRVPVKCWTGDLVIEESAVKQLVNVARLPIVGPWISVMPDVHWGNGATVGSVIPQRAAIIPAAVGVDIGCGMIAMKTDIDTGELDDRLPRLREAIERNVPVGGPGAIGSWSDTGWWKRPALIDDVWARHFAPEFDEILAAHPGINRSKKGKVKHGTSFEQLGTLGTGNHFIEICVADDNTVWFMLHSGSRGVGNRIGMYFIERAKLQAIKMDRAVKADEELAWLDEGTQEFTDYISAVGWAQRFAMRNRELMMDNVKQSVGRVLDRVIHSRGQVVNCHHNYVEKYDAGTVSQESVWLTRKGAVSARDGELGIIPGSMGAKSFIVRGKGNKAAFESCSHGAGRAMSRGAARRLFTVEQHAAATEGVECRKDAGVIDETPQAYKSIDAVMAAQTDLVDIVTTLKQVVCVKG
jgi:tRNA-splicing ligase RtcB